MDSLTAVAITVHAVAASLVVLLGPVNVIRRPKDGAHRAIGRSWVVSMYVVCVSGMFIYTLTGGFTIFHALAIFTFCTTTFGVYNIRRGRIGAHVGNMVGSYIGALVAGAFAVAVPERSVPRLAVSDPVALWSAAGAVVLAATCWVAFVLLRFRGSGDSGRPSRRGDARGVPGVGSSASS